MKTVCIVTWHKVSNYGAQLQAYALKRIFDEKGYEVYFLDYRRKINKHNYYSMLSHPLRTLKNIISRKCEMSNVERDFYFNKDSIMMEFANRHFEYNDQTYDICVVGADEIFSISDGYNGFQFAEGVKAKKFISYAASFGATTYGMIKFMKKERIIKHNLSKFEKISVRDKNSQDIICKLLNRRMELCIDPVLLWKWDNEVASFDKEKLDIIVLYSYGTHAIPEKYIDVIKKFAKEKQLMIISLGYYHDWCDRNIAVTSPEFVQYIYRAQYVLTTTFHGAVFSILFNKKFAVILQNNNKEKLGFLLQEFNATNHILNDAEEVQSIFSVNSDFSDKIESKREMAMRFLNGAVF